MELFDTKVKRIPFIKFNCKFKNVFVSSRKMHESLFNIKMYTKAAATIYIF